MESLLPRRILHLDTEFTSLGEPWPVELISAGLCDSEGEPLFYAESDSFDPALASEFTRERVLPLLERGESSMGMEELRRGFFAAIAAIGEPCALAADSPWDWLWVCMLAAGRPRADGALAELDPSANPLWPRNLCPLLAPLDFDGLPHPNRMAGLAASGRHFASRYPHHALEDAIGNALRAKAAIECDPGASSLGFADFCRAFKLREAAFEWTPKAAAPASRPH